MIPVKIANFLLAMQAGGAGAAQMEACFAPDAVYVEPFSGAVQRHEGRAAVMAAMRNGWETPLPAMHLAVDGVATEGDVVMLRWTCHSPALPGGQGRGVNRYVLRDGLIAELETRLEMGGGA
jgi:hypothetical protein